MEYKGFQFSINVEKTDHGTFTSTVNLTVPGGGRILDAIPPKEFNSEEEALQGAKLSAEYAIDRSLEKWGFRGKMNAIPG